MSHYGCTTTKVGRSLIAKILAEKIPLKITRIMVGSGVCPDDVFLGDLTDLISPVAQATSTTPTYDGDTVHMTIEYRSDMNGGLEHGFWLSEFCVFAKDLDDSEIMLYYGSLGDYPQWVSAFKNNAIDTRRYPISITVGEGAEVVIDYSPDSFMTEADLQEYVKVTLLPQIKSELQKQIDDSVKNAMETLADSVGDAKIRENIIIPKNGWVKASDTTNLDGYIYTIDVAMEGVLEKHFPSVALAIPSLRIAANAKLCPTIATFDGLVRFWAKSVPTADMTGTIALRSENLLEIDSSIATNPEVQDKIEDIWGEDGSTEGGSSGDGGSSGGDSSGGEDGPTEDDIPSGNTVATDEEVQDVINKTWGSNV